MRNHGQELSVVDFGAKAALPAQQRRLRCAMCHVPCGFRFLSIIGLTNSFADVAALVAERV